MVKLLDACFLPEVFTELGISRSDMAKFQRKMGIPGELTSHSVWDLNNGRILISFLKSSGAFYLYYLCENEEDFKEFSRQRYIATDYDPEAKWRSYR